jgi:virulence-associated protein VapD
MTDESPVLVFRELLQSFRDSLAVLHFFSQNCESLIRECDQFSLLLIQSPSLSIVPSFPEDETFFKSCSTFYKSLTFSLTEFLGALQALRDVLLVSLPAVSSACDSLITEVRTTGIPTVYWPFSRAHARILRKVEFRELRSKIESHLAIYEVIEKGVALLGSRSLRPESVNEPSKVIERIACVGKEFREVRSRWKRFEESMNDRVSVAETGIREVYEKRTQIREFQKRIEELKRFQLEEDSDFSDRIQAIRDRLQSMRAKIQPFEESPEQLQADLEQFKKRLSDGQTLRQEIEIV